MNYKYLNVQRTQHVATVTFDRPEKANATNYGLLAEIEHASLSFRDDLETRVVIFTGAGKNFCSGWDLSDPNVEYAGNVMSRRRATRIGGRAIRAICDIDQITICAWRGAAVGGGAVIATATDFRIGTNTARLCYPEVLIGMNLMWFGLPLIVHLVGPARAKRLVAGAEWLDAKTLYEWGLLEEITDKECPLELAHQWAERYVSKPPNAVQMIKQSVNKISSALDQSIMHMDVDQNLYAQSTEDSAQAIRSHVDGETAKFTGN